MKLLSAFIQFYGSNTLIKEVTIIENEYLVIQHLSQDILQPLIPVNNK